VYPTRAGLIAAATAVATAAAAPPPRNSIAGADTAAALAAVGRKQNRLAVVPPPAAATAPASVSHVFVTSPSPLLIYKRGETRNSIGMHPPTTARPTQNAR